MYKKLTWSDFVIGINALKEEEQTIAQYTK